MAGETGGTTSRVLNKLQYAAANQISDIGTAATGDLFLVADIDDDYEIKSCDGSDVLVAAGLSATATEIDRVADVSARLVAVGASLTLTAASHDGKTILLDTASGSAVTLPAATGTGALFTVKVSTTVTSNDHTIACVGTDEFAGTILQTDTDTSDTLASYPALAADNFDTVTMNGSTTGGLVGDFIELQDIATGIWSINGHINGTGTVATPLSAAV